jgi:glycine cleavage system H protein
LETSGYVDIFATKGMEYVFILGFIVVLVFFWKFLHRAGTPANSNAADINPILRSLKQCNLQQNLYYHQGHSWVKQEGSEVARIGIDDFAQRLIGRVDVVDLPRIGAFLAQGEKGWSLGSDSAPIDILSPVAGEVLAINQEALNDPQVVNRDPYGNGWLLKVRVPKMKSNATNLLTGKLAAVWMKDNIEAFCRKISEDNSLSARFKLTPENESADDPLQDKWNELVCEFLLCK